jgi:hypothetical protein
MEYSAATESCVDALVDVRKRALDRGSTSEALWHITPECLKIAMRSEETGSEALASGAQLAPFSRRSLGAATNHPAIRSERPIGIGLVPCEVRLLRSFGILAHKLKRIGCGLLWLSMDRFPERWIIILRAVYPRRNFPHLHLIGRVGNE